MNTRSTHTSTICRYGGGVAELGLCVTRRIANIVQKPLKMCVVGCVVRGVSVLGGGQCQ